jgi:hypothetical protein
VTLAGEAAEQGGEREEREPADEDALAPDPVGERAAREDQRGEVSA